MDTFHIELVVRLIIPDSTATTAKQALHRLGMTVVAEVHRYERWLFAFEGDSGAWPALGERLRGVDVLVNANKHKATVALATSGDHLAVPAPVRGSEDLSPEWIFVQSAHDPRADSVGRVLRDRLGFVTLRRSDRWDVWLLEVVGNDRAVARAIAERAAESLLANPQFQTAQVVAGGQGARGDNHG